MNTFKKYNLLFIVISLLLITQNLSAQVYQGPAQSYTGYVDKSYYNGFPIPDNGHKIYFGWFRGYGPNDNQWTGERGWIKSGGAALADLPDSVDCVSLFVVSGEMTDARKKDLEAFQSRGAKALFSISTQGLMTQFPAVMGRPTRATTPEQWAEQIFECCKEYHFNGFDWGFENSTASIWGGDAPNKIINKLRELFDKFNAELGDPNHKYKMYLAVDIPNPSQGYQGSVKAFTNESLKKIDLFLWQFYDIPVNKDNFGGNSYSVNYDTVESALNKITNIAVKQSANSSNVVAMTPEVKEHLLTHSVSTASMWTVNVTNQPKEWAMKNFKIAGFGVYYLDLDGMTNRQEWYTLTKRCIRILNKR